MITSQTTGCFLLLTLSVLSTLDQPTPPKRETPRSIDPRLEVVLFAQEPQIVHPVAIAFDKRGRLLAIESHTHFRPKEYSGPKYDRIRLLEDTDGDGRADRFTTFFEGTTATMDIAVHPDGSVYLATRNEILRLRDTDGDGAANQKERIVFLETKGDYPHNGLSGIAFDLQGNLFFGLGENLGVGYRLTGSDGTTIADEGEGGNICWCKATGMKLRRFATGFWNPFGVHMDSLGRIFAVDNDPDSMPPCRMLHIVEGGDYGYQFRYGRSGRHPFQAWNGQLPGTLPMLVGTGEAPCEVLCYESGGLPAEYFGNYFVTAWADHRLERYELKEKGASFTTEQKILIQGGKNFRPNGLAVAPDGSLFMSDWVLPDYTLHNQGAIWHVRTKAPQTKKPASLQELHSTFRTNIGASALAQDVRAKLQKGKDLREYLNKDHPGLVRVEAIPSLNHLEDLTELLSLATDDDPFVKHAARMHLARSGKMLDAVDPGSLKPAGRIALLLAQRASRNPKYHPTLSLHLKDEDEDVRFLAAKWIADETLTAFRQQIEEASRDPRLSVRMAIAYATALARIDLQEVSEAKLADRFAQRLEDAGTSDDLKLQLLRLVPVGHPKLSIKLLEKLLQSPDAQLQQDAVLALCLHSNSEHKGALHKAAHNLLLSEEARALARMGLSVQPEKRDLTQAKNRPHADDLPAWLTRFGSGGNADAGRRVFYHPQHATCCRCHQIDGRGNEIGPDLSTIGRSEPKRILESLLQPSATVAPHYQAWTLAMHDGRVLTGILARTYLDEYTYLDPQGKPFTVKSQDIAETKASSKSIMPEDLLAQLTDQEVRDLMAYLFSRK